MLYQVLFLVIIIIIIVVVFFAVIVIISVSVSVVTVTFLLFKSCIIHSQPQYGWLTRPHLSCHIWKLIMQLGQPQSVFANRKESLVGRVM